jgi:tetratricopeptide (TPR) repeat protein
METLTGQQKLKVLFFSSDPSNESRLHLGRELQRIKEKLKENKEFIIHEHLATTPNDVMQEIMTLKPQIVHFSGHGSAEGELKFEDETGKAKSVAPEALATLFSCAKDFVKCVLVNTCYAEKQAKAIAQYIPVVIGTRSEISDEAAISFSSGFYTALNPELSIESIDNAFTLGKVAIQFSGTPGDHIPIIIYGSVNVRFAAEVDTAFRFIKNPKGKAVDTLIHGLSLTGRKMGLTEDLVNRIIDDKIANLNAHNANLVEYEKRLKDILRDEYPLSPSSVGALSYLQSGLSLTNEDVKAIQDKIFSDPSIESAYSWYDRGYGQLLLGNYESSVEYFTKAIEKNEDYSAAYSQRGLSYSKEKQYKKAIPDFTKAIEINKNWEISSNLSLTLFDRGFAYIDLGLEEAEYLEKGIEDFKEIIELNPNEIAAYYNIGIGYERLKNYKEAVKWHIEAVERNYTDMSSAYRGIIKCYSELAEDKKMKEWLGKYQEWLKMENETNKAVNDFIKID